MLKAVVLSCVGVVLSIVVGIEVYSSLVSVG